MAIIRVVFDWDDRFGRCYECGVPAAYASSDHDSQPENLRCSVCAALDASNGATIRYLFDERSNWERDEYQFPRLLAEIMANVDLDDDMLRPVAESMELELDDVLELFNRAQLTWERVKAVTT